MNAIIFVGPSLRPEDIASYSKFIFLPPVRQGDVYRASLDRPKAIAVVDGYFDGVPAVMHKEILWAMSMGIAVFGAASMGALRAAELHSFGMRGVGGIFADYRDGRLVDDDEVALVHGPAETGYQKLSEPMVNIRATLKRAMEEKVLNKEAVDHLIRVAKSQFYQERTWATVLEGCKKLSQSKRGKFARWFKEGQRDQKREDALLLLQAVEEFLLRGTPEPPVAYSFEWTENFANAPWRNAGPLIDGKGTDQEILDELRLAGEAYVRLRCQALLRILANEAVHSGDGPPTRAEIVQAKTEFRMQRDLGRADSFGRWLIENELGAARFDSLIADHAAIEKLARDRDRDLHQAILDELRVEGTYRRLKKQAEAKRKMLASDMSVERSLLPVLVSWYFGTRLKCPIPPNLAEYAARLGIDDLARFYALITEEYALVGRTRSRKPRRSQGKKLT